MNECLARIKEDCDDDRAWERLGTIYRSMATFGKDVDEYNEKAKIAFKACTRIRVKQTSRSLVEQAHLADAMGDAVVYDQCYKLLRVFSPEDALELDKQH